MNVRDQRATPELISAHCRALEAKYGGHYIAVKDCGLLYFIDVDCLLINGRPITPEELEARFGPTVRS